MARLNELPGPTESIEALKRRFVRQNREIARVNSLQSLRIQGLESELSNLLKENAALKEQVISLTQDAEKYEAGRALHKDIHQYKEKLAAKVSELNSLVSELGLLPGNFIKKTAHLEATGDNLENKRSSDANRRPITWNENGDRLPTILEDKYFPRRTLNPEELAETYQYMDSPSIGSPPIAHFDVDQSPYVNTILSTKEIASSDPEEHINSFRNSPDGINHEEVPVMDQPTSSSIPISLPILSGSKRKFSATEDEVRFSPLSATGTTTIDDDFQFTRADDIQRMRRPNVAVEIVSEPKKQQQKKGGPAKRRALEPKTTNMTSSPRKIQRGGNVQKADVGEPEDITKRRGEEESLRKTRDWGKVSQSQSDHAKKTKRIATPTLEDEPMKKVSDSLVSLDKDHIQESFSADEPAVADSTPLPGLGSRPSRRARGAISYAEPNLRDKMRRATNELVDAVMIGAGAGAGRRTSTPFSGNPGQEYESEQSTLAYIPEEQGASARKVDASGIPHNIQGLAQLPKNMVTERKRRTLSASTNDITRPNSVEFESDPKRNFEVDNSQALLNILADKGAVTNTQEYSRRRSTNSNAQSRRHSSNPGVYDRGKPTHNDKSSNHDPYETSEIDSDYNDDTSEEDLQARSTLSKATGTARVKATRTLMDDTNSQAKRGQRASARRRSMLV